jgi:hypothetical protein
MNSPTPIPNTNAVLGLPAILDPFDFVYRVNVKDLFRLSKSEFDTVIDSIDWKSNENHIAFLRVYAGSIDFIHDIKDPPQNIPEDMDMSEFNETERHEIIRMMNELPLKIDKLLLNMPDNNYNLYKFNILRQLGFSVPTNKTMVDIIDTMIFVLEKLNSSPPILK